MADKDTNYGNSNQNDKIARGVNWSFESNSNFTSEGRRPMNMRGLGNENAGAGIGAPIWSGNRGMNPLNNFLEPSDECNPWIFNSQESSYDSDISTSAEPLHYTEIDPSSQFQEWMGAAPSAEPPAWQPADSSIENPTWTGAGPSIEMPFWSETDLSTEIPIWPDFDLSAEIPVWPEADLADEQAAWEDTVSSIEVPEWAGTIPSIEMPEWSEIDTDISNWTQPIVFPDFPDWDDFNVTAEMLSAEPPSATGTDELPIPPTGPEIPEEPSTEETENQVPPSGTGPVTRPPAATGTGPATRPPAATGTGPATRPPAATGTGPATRPPANRPPANRPPANRPPANRPPANRPPANRPPANRPPANRPPFAPPTWIAPRPPQPPTWNTPLPNWPIAPTEYLSEMRFLNASSRAGAVDLYLDGLLYASNVRLGSITTYRSISDGFHTVAVRGATGTKPILFQKNFPFAAGERLTLILVDTADGDFDVMQVAATGCINMPRNTGCYRLANVSYPNSSYNLTMHSGETVFSNVKFQEITAYKQAMEGTYQFYVTSTGAFRPIREIPIIVLGGFSPVNGMIEPVASFQVELEAGKNYTTFLIGNNWGNETLQTLTVED